MKEKLKITNGIYYLYLSDEIVYIGSSFCCERRVYSHLKDKKFTHISIEERSETGTELLKIESDLIAEHLPKYNKRLSDFSSYISIRLAIERIESRTLNLCQSFDHKRKIKRKIQQSLSPAFVLNGVSYFVESEITSLIENNEI